MAIDGEKQIILRRILNRKTPSQRVAAFWLTQGWLFTVWSQFLTMIGKVEKNQNPPRCNQISVQFISRWDLGPLLWRLRGRAASAYWGGHGEVHQEAPGGQVPTPEQRCQGARVSSVYQGGNTPTSSSPSQAPCAAHPHYPSPSGGRDYAWVDCGHCWCSPLLRYEGLW